MIKFKSQALHVIRIRYWKAGGSGNLPSFISTNWNIGNLLYKQATRTKHFDGQCKTSLIHWIRFYWCNGESLCKKCLTNLLQNTTTVQWQRSKYSISCLDDIKCGVIMTLHGCKSRFLSPRTKGQLISKGLFGFFNSPQKTNEKFLPH